MVRHKTRSHGAARNNCVMGHASFLHGNKAELTLSYSGKQRNDSSHKQRKLENNSNGLPLNTGRDLDLSLNRKEMLETFLN